MAIAASTVPCTLVDVHQSDGRGCHHQDRSATASGEMFATVDLPGRSGVRVGIDRTGQAAVFFETGASSGTRRSFSLASVRYEPDVGCKFDGGAVERRCAVLRCTTPEDDVRALFLRVAESWIPTVPPGNVGLEIDAAAAQLIELFNSLRTPGRGTVLGLWGELFLLAASDNPRDLLRTWHADPFELHDFVSTNVRLEVKTAVDLRQHEFSLDQLLPPVGSHLYVCSIVTRSSLTGMSIQDLQEWLLSRLNDVSLAFRVQQIVAATLGERWSEVAKQRYSQQLALESIRFLDGASIPKVNLSLPPEVSRVRFSVELDDVPTVRTVPFPGLGSTSNLMSRE